MKLNFLCNLVLRRDGGVLFERTAFALYKSLFLWVLISKQWTHAEESSAVEFIFI